ncbi:hypothetical protein KSF73_13730 [Burkholderiaceae bacterium DAT-1]|nr:hypothetical protein [Burkholderiaceae bacterium DAT-1]
MLDQLEACFREQSTAMDYASRGQYFRKAQAGALHGSFAQALKNTNQSIAQLETHASQMQAKHDAEQHALAELKELVQHALSGDFSRQIPTQGKSGFTLELIEGLNLLSSKVESNMRALAEVMNHIAAGSLQLKMEGTYSGVFADIQRSTNNMVSCLSQVIEQDVVNLVSAASQGDFSQRIDCRNQKGFFAQLSNNLNTLSELTETSLNDFAAAMNCIKHGDLTSPIQAEYSGIFNQLKHDINDTIQKLLQMISEVNDSATFVSQAATEISAGNLDLSRRTESQAASLEQTASTMEEITGTVKQSADNAKLASRLAHESSAFATRGGEIMQQVIQTMEEIDNSSKQVTDIISVIDGIAFQTNILALNAAVEAARAGEQGRGFAVVASEVRSLAQRSASAAREVKTLIQNSRQKVDEGHKLVSSAGSSMNEIVESVERVSGIIVDISAAASEQTNGIDQINIAVAQLDSTTQQNAALVEEASAAAENLDEQSKHLLSIVSRFKLSQTTSSHSIIQRTKHPAPRLKQPSSVHPTSKSSDEWAEF